MPRAFVDINASGSRVVVYEKEISELFSKGQPVSRFTSQVSRRIMTVAQRTAPSRNDQRNPHVQLKDSHFLTGARKVGRFKALSSVRNNAPHAEFVHFGTMGPITARSGGRLSVPVANGGVLARNYGRHRFHPKSVEGQREQPWLYEAAVTVLRAEGIA